MMVDDEPINIEMTQAFLEEVGYTRFCSTTDPAQALRILRVVRPHVILLDIQMPAVSGFDILQAMRADETLRHIPVIVLTGAVDSDTKLKALELGASDFLNKPVDASELVLRLRNTLAARAYQEHLTYYDRLTGLPNRQRCLDEIDRALRRAQRLQRTGALIQIDIDRFTQINEALGPSAGDTLLQQIALRLADRVSVWSASHTNPETFEVPQLSRLSADEFMIVLPQLQSIGSVADLAASLREAASTPAYQIAGHEVVVTVSQGVAMFPGDGSEVDQLLQHVGSAIHHAKQAGRNTCQFYAPELNARAIQHLSVENDLRKAIERNEFCIYYQPKIDLATGHLSGAEALIRWNHPERGLLGPGEFIPVAETVNLIVPTGSWVIREVHRQAVAWHTAGLPAIMLSINVSARQFAQADFIENVRRVMAGGGMAGHLCFELTETSMMEKPESKIEGLKELKNLGLSLSIDDFGVGYSSFSYLRRMPIDELKIDKSFVDEIESSEDSAAIVIAIIAMAKSLGLATVAEGVETEGQARFLRENGCGDCQGYFFARPMPAIEFEEQWLRKTAAFK
ncbi:MAG: gmr 3 [Betaproteobacteria bacterium]|nr:gmr 3 [Betaproteobacteria bacterium]